MPSWRGISTKVRVLPVSFFAQGVWDFCFRTLAARILPKPVVHSPVSSVLGLGVSPWHQDHKMLPYEHASKQPVELEFNYNENQKTGPLYPRVSQTQHSILQILLEASSMAHSIPSKELRFQWEFHRGYQEIFAAQVVQLGSLEQKKKAQEHLENSWTWNDQKLPPMENAINLVHRMVAWEISGLTPSQNVLNHWNHVLWSLTWANEDRGGFTTNHYLSQLAGIIIGSVYLGHSIDKWIPIFEREVLLQFYADGCNFEESTQYHRFSFELVYWTARAITRAGKPLSPAVHQRIERAYLVMDKMSWQGVSPCIGDSDGGRFIPLLPREVTNWKYWFASQKIDFWESQMLEEGHWKFPQVDNKESVKSSCNLLTRFEFQTQDAHHVIFVSHGVSGQHGNRGHAHDDHGAYTWLMKKDAENIVQWKKFDPGSGCYLADFSRRQYLRSASAHGLPFQRSIAPVAFTFYPEKDLQIFYNQNSPENLGDFLFEVDLWWGKRKFYLHQETVVTKDEVSLGA